MVGYNQLYHGSTHIGYISKNGQIVKKVYKGSTLVYKLGFDPVTFNVSSSLQTFIVPLGVSKIHVDCVASKGNDGRAAGGYGGRVQCDLTVTGGETLYIMVGDIPSSAQTASYNASDIRVNGTDYSNRIIVAGGGGSGSYGNANRPNNSVNGGAGGGTVGGQGANTAYNVGGFGGTQTSGGARGYATDTGGTTGAGYGNAGGYPLGGNGVSGPGNYNYTYSGAGGAGYYGGGSGGTYEYFGTNMAGGGGGSSYTNASCSNVVHTQGYRNGAGYVTISFVS